MSVTKKVIRITKLEEESRKDQVQRGMKSGSAKAAADKGIKTAADPISSVVKQMLKKANIQNGVSDKSVELLSEAIVGYAIADVIAAIGPLAEKVPGLKNFDKEKTEQIGRWFRGYTGDKVGTQAADGLFTAGPIVAQLMSNSIFGELLNSDDIPVAQLTEGPKLDTLPDNVGPQNKEKKNGKNNS